jgi:hypothetical protein
LLERQEQEALSPARREAPAQPTENQAEDDAVVADAVEVDPPVDVAEPEVAAPEDFQEPASPDIPEFAVPPPASVVDEPALEAEPLAPTEPPPGDVAESEDVLEETPEFLQETPEHDRLWFEQKPPRDFDFDDEDR